MSQFNNSTRSVEVDKPETKYEIAGGWKHGNWERHVPQWAQHRMHLFHIARYRYAFDHLTPNDIVLDIGCGVGYGSEIIARRAKSVLGIDINYEAIEFAQKHYQSSNLIFSVGNWTEALFEKDYSFIVAFEFLEHISEQKHFIASVREALCEDGILFISTPNAALSSGGNPYHLRELSLLEFRDLLTEHFRSVQIVGQYVKPEFLNRQRLFFDYIDSQYLPLPGFLKRRLGKQLCLIRKDLERNFIGLQLEDILFSGGDEMNRIASFLIAKCQP